MKSLSFFLRSIVALPVLAIAVSCCSAGIDEADDAATAEPELSALSVAPHGTWVSQGSGFGPCQVLPTTCTVGDQIDAHSGPGFAGGCYLYKCKQLGTWVSHGSAFGPCQVLPATCTVGDKIGAHSGPGLAGGCYSYTCE